MVNTHTRMVCMLPNPSRGIQVMNPFKLTNWYVHNPFWEVMTPTHTHREGIAHIELCTLTPILGRCEMRWKYKDHEPHLQRYKSVIKLLHQTQECMSIRFNHNFKHNCTHALLNTCPLTSSPSPSHFRRSVTGALPSDQSAS